MSNNELEELMICVCDHFGITKKQIVTNRNIMIFGQAKQTFVHLVHKHNLMDAHRLAYFLDTTVKVVYRTNIKATSRILYWPPFRFDYSIVEQKFLNKELSIYNKVA